MESPKKQLQHLEQVLILVGKQGKGRNQHPELRYSNT